MPSGRIQTAPLRKGVCAGFQRVRVYLNIGEQTVNELARLFDVADDAALDRGQIVSIAHCFAGASLTVGAMRVGLAARALQHAAKSSDTTALRVDALRAEQDRLRTEFNTARRAVSEFIADLRLDVAA